VGIATGLSMVALVRRISSPAMDELHGFCVRMLGHGEAAEAAERAGRQAAQGDRVQALTTAAAACRAHEDAEAETTDDRAEPGSLAEAVARELAQATAQLPERQREALALRELLGLSYEEVGAVVGLDPSAVGPLLARARLRLRIELRGEGAALPPCDERERALRTIALRQDGEPVFEADEDWLIEHLGHCAGCARAHSTMLEASACYRAWRLDQEAAAPAGAGADAPS
jgi:RNA polymerase sigma factor (sigma-70 family)